MDIEKYITPKKIRYLEKGKNIRHDRKKEIKRVRKYICQRMEIKKGNYIPIEKINKTIINKNLSLIYNNMPKSILKKPLPESETDSESETESETGSETESGTETGSYYTESETGSESESEYESEKE